ncbi:uncharacterized protein [Periplaneta americana]|uniref:uncharacterized protein isoform X4 n=1 Tax=Periplaneta americana TaxID=6978 RepID=UPI0037E8D71C
MSFWNSSRVIMDVIKTEPEVDPLASVFKEADVDNEKPLSEEENFFEVNVNENKLEPPILSCDLKSDIKREENDDTDEFPVVKYEVEDDSWNLNAVKEELVPDVMEKDDVLTETSSLKTYTAA